MNEADRKLVLSIEDVNGSEIIDGGDTIVVHLQRPGEQELAILVPHNAAADLAARLICDIEIARKRRLLTNPHSAREPNSDLPGTDPSL